MMRMVDLFRQTKWTVLLSLIVTLLFADFIYAPAKSFYNTTAPVVEMSGKLVHTDGHSTLIHISGKKLRECKFIRINSYYVFKGNGMLVEAFLERMAGPIDGSTKPVGEFDLGFWRIWPTDEATKVLVYVHHECGGETVLSKIAEVPLIRG